MGFLDNTTITDAIFDKKKVVNFWQEGRMNLKLQSLHWQMTRLIIIFTIQHTQMGQTFMGD